MNSAGALGVVGGWVGWGGGGGERKEQKKGGLKKKGADSMAMPRYS